MAKNDTIAIDFRFLLREEKKRAKQRTKEVNQALEKQEIDTTSSMRYQCNNGRPQLPPWSHIFDAETIPCLDRRKHRVSKAINDVYYVPHFLSDQSTLWEWLQALPENTSGSALPVSSAEGRWTTMTYGKRRVALFIKDLPPPLQQLGDLLVAKGIFPPSQPPNHILVNEYHPGQGILPHTDGPAYMAQTATLSIGNSSVLLKFAPRLHTNEIGRIAVETCEEVLLEGNGSLVVFGNDAYSDYTHGIDVDTHTETASIKCVNAPSGTPVIRGHRISLTFRHAWVRS